MSVVPPAVVLSYADEDSASADAVAASLRATLPSVQLLRPSQSPDPRRALSEALAAAPVALLFVSEAYLRDPIVRQIVPRALDAAGDRLTVISIRVRPCRLQGQWLGRRALFGDGTPLDELDARAHQRLLDEVVAFVAGLSGGSPLAGAGSAGAQRPWAFLITSFDPSLEGDNRAITSALDACGLGCVVANRFFRSEPVDANINRWIETADLVIANASIDSQNVYYEVGYARALRRPLIICAHRKSQIHFNIVNINRLEYATAHELGHSLTRWIQSTREPRLAPR